MFLPFAVTVGSPITVAIIPISVILGSLLRFLLKPLERVEGAPTAACRQVGRPASSLESVEGTWHPHSQSPWIGFGARKIPWDKFFQLDRHLRAVEEPRKSAPPLCRKLRHI